MGILFVVQAVIVGQSASQIATNAEVTIEGVTEKPVGFADIARTLKFDESSGFAED